MSIGHEGGILGSEARDLRNVVLRMRVKLNTKRRVPRYSIVFLLYK